jgi:hypothetical protein
MWQRCGSHRGQSKSRFTLFKVNKTLTLIGRTRTLSDVTDGRTDETDAQTTLPAEDGAGEVAEEGPGDEVPSETSLAE